MASTTRPLAVASDEDLYEAVFAAVLRCNGRLAVDLAYVLTDEERKEVVDVCRAGLLGMWGTGEASRLLELGTSREVAQEARRRMAVHRA